MRIELEDKNCFVSYQGSIWQVMDMTLDATNNAITRLEFRFGPTPPRPDVFLSYDDLPGIRGVSEMEVILAASQCPV